MKKVFVTGSTGFVGKNLIKSLDKNGIANIAGSRNTYGDMVAQSNWESLLADCDVVIHLAARVHVMEETEADPMIAFRKSNVEATQNLANAAKASGVKRFIFISSIKVNGEETHQSAFKASDEPHPLDTYGLSKFEAESELMKLHTPGVFEIVIIRPPLVYGLGVKANFDKLFWLVKKDLPIPFGRVKNKRSMVSVLNLCDLIIRCIDHSNASGEVFLVSDDKDYSLKDLIILMAKTEGKYPHLLPVPVGMMKLAATMLGKKSYTNRLFGNLHVDIAKTKSLLNWQPPYTFEETFKT